MTCSTRLNEDGQKEKHCPKCNDWWPGDSEFFHRNPTNPDGLDTYCRACRLEVRAQAYLRKKEKQCLILSGLK